MESRKTEIWVGKADVKSTSVFQAKALYVELHDWLIENGYSPPYDTSFPERRIWEARTQSGHKEYWIWWRPFKVIEGNQFWRRVINVDMHGVGVTPVEIMYKGKKLRCDKGKFEVLLSAKLEIDVGGTWVGNGFLRPFLEPFWKRIFRKEIEMYRKEVLSDLKTIQDLARRWFDLDQFTTNKHPFMPKKGYEEEEF
jgi:hypothetical protein